MTTNEKKESDKNALRKALKDGYIDYVATDHAPHVFEDKKLPIFECFNLPLSHS